MAELRRKAVYPPLNSVVLLCVHFVAHVNTRLSCAYPEGKVLFDSLPLEHLNKLTSPLAAEKREKTQPSTATMPGWKTCIIRKSEWAAFRCGLEAPREPRKDEGDREHGNEGESSPNMEGAKALWIDGAGTLDWVQASGKLLPSVPQTVL